MLLRFLPPALMLLLGAFAAGSEPAQLLKIAALAPEGSSWVTAARASDAELRERTDGQLGLRIYPGGVHG